jgi:hypothetical protein
MVLSSDNRLLDVGLETEEYLITHFKTALYSFFVRLAFHSLLHP